VTVLHESTLLRLRLARAILQRTTTAMKALDGITRVGLSVVVLVIGPSLLDGCSSSGSATATFDDAGNAIGDGQGTGTGQGDGGALEDGGTGGEPCSATACAAPPATACVDASTLRTYASSGTCTSGTCSYAHSDALCAHGCQGNTCVGADPCNGVTCIHPPPSSCTDPGTQKSYPTSGTCAGGTCSYAATTSTCLSASGACVTRAFRRRSPATTYTLAR
jgi:hypothetical protein